MCNVIRELLSQFLKEQDHRSESRDYADDSKCAAVAAELHEIDCEFATLLESPRQEKCQLEEQLEELRANVSAVEQRIETITRHEEELESDHDTRKQDIIRNYEDAYQQLALQRKHEDLEESGHLIRNMKRVLEFETPPPPPKRRMTNFAETTPEVPEKSEFEEMMKDLLRCDGV